MLSSKTFKSAASKSIILLGAFLLTFYIYFRIQLINFTPLLAVFSLLLFLAEAQTFFHLYGMFYSLWPRKYQQFEKLNESKDLKLNIFICVCGESLRVVHKTILGAQSAVKEYRERINPKIKPRIYVLNDGKAAKKENWQQIEALCKLLGVEHIAREKPGGFKAGNLNNALKLTPSRNSKNTLDIVLDADCVPTSEFLIEITKPFADKKTDFVQTPQFYRDDHSWVAKASSAHQSFFYNYICPTKGHDNAVFLCGTNFAIRRSALKDVSGFDTKYITEDYATSIKLHLQGKKGVFLNKVIAEGIAPQTVNQYFNQQKRWAKGSFDTNFANLKDLLFGSLSLKQKFHYLLSATYYLVGLRDLIFLLAPISYLLFNVSLVKESSLGFLLVIYFPSILYNLLVYIVLFKHPVKSFILSFISLPVITLAFLSSLLGKNLEFKVTSKEQVLENPFKVYTIQIMLMFLLISAVIYKLSQPTILGGGLILNNMWTIFNLTLLALGFLLMLRDRYQFRLQFPFKVVQIYKPVMASLLLIAYSFLYFNILGNQIYAQQSIGIFAQFSQKKELLVPSYGTYYGYYMPDLNDHSKDTEVKLSESDSPSLALFYQDWAQDKGFDFEFMSNLDKKGVVPVVTWEPWDSRKSFTGQVDPEYSLQSIIDGKHDEYVKKWAKGAALYNKPLFLRFAHEMNGNWYPWGNSPEQYKLAWIHIHEIFVKEGAKNVIWVWSPNNSDHHNRTDNLLDYYPGDEYVDWVGFSGFNWGTNTQYSVWKSFKQIADNTYKVLSQLNKPIMVTETSSVSKGGNKSAWFNKTLSEDIPSYPKVKAVILFNQDYNGANFALNQGMDAQLMLDKNITNNSYYLKKPLFKINN